MFESEKILLLLDMYFLVDFNNAPYTFSYYLVLFISKTRKGIILKKSIEKKEIKNLKKNKKEEKTRGKIMKEKGKEVLQNLLIFT